MHSFYEVFMKYSFTSIYENQAINLTLLPEMKELLLTSIKIYNVSKRVSLTFTVLMQSTLTAGLPT